MFRTSGAVQSDNAHAHALEDREHCGDICAQQHLAVDIQCDLRLDRKPGACILKSQLDAVDGGFDFQDIIRGLDQQQIHTTFNQAAGLLAEDVHKLVIGDVGHFRIVGGNEFSGGADRAGNKAGFFRRAVFISGSAGELRGSKIDIVGFVSQGVICQGQAISPEAIRLNHVGSSLKVRLVDPGNRLRRRKGEIVVTTVITLAAKVRRGQFLQLQHGTHGAIEDQNTLVEFPEVCVFFG